MASIWFKLLFYFILLHRTLDEEQEEAPLGNIPLCGMGFYWCKMCVRLDYYAQLWQPSRSNGLQVFGLEVAHCGTGLAKAQAQALAVSVKFKVTDKGLSNVVGRRKRGNAICNGLLLLPWRVFRQSLRPCSSLCNSVLSPQPPSILSFSLQSQLLHQLAFLLPGLAFAKTLSLSVSLPKKDFNTRIVNTLPAWQQRQILQKSMTSL